MVLENKKGKWKMRILLVDPPSQRFVGFYRFYFPLGLAYIAAVLRDKGHEVLIYDGDHDIKCTSIAMRKSEDIYKEALKDNTHPIWLEYIQVLGDFKPQIVGISVMSVKMLSALKLATITKKWIHGTIVVCGGKHATMRPNDLICPDVDYVICGEGEESFAKLIDQIQDGRQSPRIIKASPIMNLDGLPFPATECLMQPTSYRSIDFGLMITARGCSHECRFCSLSSFWDRKVRFHSIERVCDEIADRKEKYNTSYFSFRDGTFSLNRSRSVELCHEIQNRDLSIEWECLTRVDRLDAELLKQMKMAGCKTIRIGIESGSQKVLKYMNKDISLSQIRKAAEILNQSGIFWAAYFMLGVPVETDETINETLALIKEIQPPFVTLARYIPLPGTPMFEDVVDIGLLDPEEEDWTWAFNQSLERCFVQHMSQEKFNACMEEVMDFVKEYNAKSSLIRSDPRIK